MKRSTLTILAVFVVLPVAGLVVFNTMFVKIPIDRVGVKINQFTKGIDPIDYPPGYVFIAPIQHKVELMDPTYETLHMVSGPGADAPALRLRLKDGFQTVVDITVVYRLLPGKAHLAIQRHGSGDRFKLKLKTIAEKYIWDVLTELATEDFYNSPVRLAQATKARDLMNEELAEEFIEVIDILIRDIQYDEGFEGLLREKQKLDQERLLFASKKKLEDEKKVTELIERDTNNSVVKIREEQSKSIRELVASTDAEIAKLLADANKKAETLIAEAKAQAREMIAEGELAMVVAAAEGEKAINDAYRVPGGELYIARQMVQNIRLGEIEINTNAVNPFDVRQMLGMLGVVLPPDAPAEARAER